MNVALLGEEREEWGWVARNKEIYVELQSLDVVDYGGYKDEKLKKVKGKRK